MLAHLADISIRVLVLVLAAAMVLWMMRRRRTAALQHAVWTAVLCGMLALFAFGQVLVGQVAAAPEKPLAFDVASVKPIPGDIMETRPTRSGGRFIWTTGLSYLISYAWHLPFTRISGPIPGSASIFHVEATFDPAATEDQVRAMLRSLLQNRFKLVAHLVMKDADGYALSVGKNGLKIKAFKADDPPPPLPEWSRDASVAGFEGQIAATMPEANVVAITGRRVSITQFTETLQRMLPQMVWDQTGLTGNYYIAFRFAREDNPDVNAPTLAVALRESLGLELKKRKGCREPGGGQYGKRTDGELRKYAGSSGGCFDSSAHPGSGGCYCSVADAAHANSCVATRCSGSVGLDRPSEN